GACARPALPGPENGKRWPADRGVAHDFNDLLTAVGGSLGLLKHLTTDQRALRLLDTAEKRGCPRVTADAAASPVLPPASGAARKVESERIDGFVGLAAPPRLGR